MSMVFFCAKRRAHSSPFRESTEKSTGTIKWFMVQGFDIYANLTKSAEIYYIYDI
jgi:hypothetical protein